MSDKTKKIAYLIGIQGSGMTALAQILQEMGYVVSGSDVKKEYFTAQVLRDLGIKYKKGFTTSNVPRDADVVVYSAAYQENHEEVSQAKAYGVSVYTYPEMLGKLMNETDSYGICGSHGKTTTTAMLGTVYIEAGEDPSVIVGSAVASLGGRNARSGNSGKLIAELCEYRRHFLYSKPKTSIITNIEWDHPDAFPTFRDFQKSFLLYLRQLPIGARVIYNIDDDVLREMMADMEFLAGQPKLISYGFSDDADFRILKIELRSGQQVFDVSFQGRSERFILQVPGRHNVHNACSVIACGVDDGLGVDDIKKGLLSYVGASRRFEHKGIWNGVEIIDDYAHHPTEIKVTLAGARELFQMRKIWCVFQPHTYSRTKALFEEFSRSFDSIDAVIITDIFPSAREVPDPAVTGKRLAGAVDTRHTDARYIATFEECAKYLMSAMKAGDVLITMGAGDASEVGDILLKKDKLIKVG